MKVLKLTVRFIFKPLIIIIKKNDFCPDFIGMFVNPFYFARKGLCEQIKSVSHYIMGKVLDVGCGTKPYRNLFKANEYIGLELQKQSQEKPIIADYVYDGSVFPFNNSSFDSVVLFQVFEHVFNPSQFISEIRRVLIKGGYVLMTVPFIWDEHEQPYDFARYSSFGLQSILIEHGFRIIEQRKSISDIRVIFQLINAYLYKITITKNAFINILLTLFLMAPWNIVGSLIYGIFPKNNDLYLDNIILAQKDDENE
jgi:SAM-dependent methyltransferase